MIQYRQEVKAMNTMKLIIDDCIQIGGLSINMMHNNKSGKPFIVIEGDEGDLLIMEVATYGEKSKG